LGENDYLDDISSARFARADFSGMKKRIVELYLILERSSGAMDAKEFPTLSNQRK
jgi:hypothetical protein